MLFVADEVVASEGREMEGFFGKTSIVIHPTAAQRYGAWGRRNGACYGKTSGLRLRSECRPGKHGSEEYFFDHGNTPSTSTQARESPEAAEIGVFRGLNLSKTGHPGTTLKAAQTYGALRLSGSCLGPKGAPSAYVAGVS
jgi:hypothetical protein